MLNIALCDDLKSECEKLNGWLGRYAKERSIECKVTCFTSGPDLLRAYGKQYDLIILDVEMPAMDGLEVAKRIRMTDEIVTILFVTQYRDYALDSFRVNAGGYFLKSGKYNEFFVEFSRILKKIDRQNNHIIIGDNQNEQVVTISSIVYLQYYDHKVTIHFMDGSEKIIRMSLKSVMEQDKEEYFLQIHRGTVVNKLWITKCERQMIRLKGIHGIFFVSRPKWRTVESAYLEFFRRNLM